MHNSPSPSHEPWHTFRVSSPVCVRSLRVLAPLVKPERSMSSILRGVQSVKSMWRAIDAGLSVRAHSSPPMSLSRRRIALWIHGIGKHSPLMRYTFWLAFENPSGLDIQQPNVSIFRLITNIAITHPRTTLRWSRLTTVSTILHPRTSIVSGLTAPTFP